MRRTEDQVTVVTGAPPVLWDFIKTCEPTSRVYSQWHVCPPDLLIESITIRESVFQKVHWYLILKCLQWIQYFALQGLLVLVTYKPWGRNQQCEVAQHDDIPGSHSSGCVTWSVSHKHVLLLNGCTVYIHALSPGPLLLFARSLTSYFARGPNCLIPGRGVDLVKCKD